MIQPPDNKYSYDEYHRTPDGKLYRWDPDYCVWYLTMSREEWEAQTHWQKYNWIYVSIVLAILCYIVEVYK